MRKHFKKKQVSMLVMGVLALATADAMAMPVTWTLHGEFDRFGNTDLGQAYPFTLNFDVDLENTQADIDPAPGPIYGAVGQRDFDDVVTRATMEVFGFKYDFSGTPFNDGTADLGDMFLINDSWDRLHFRAGARSGEWVQTEGAAMTVPLQTVVFDIYDYGYGGEPTPNMFNGWAFPDNAGFFSGSDARNIYMGFENGVVFYGNVDGLSIESPSPVPDGVEHASLTDMPAILSGEWRTLSGEEARRAFFQLFLGMRSHFDLLGDIRQLRALSLPFYANATLVEARGWDTWGHPLVLNAVVRADNVVALDGTSIPIHDLNAVQAPTLESEEQAKAYLRFFTGAIQSKEGPFQIVEKPSDLWWNAGQRNCQRDPVFTGMLEPLAAQRDGQGGWNANATMVHSNVLFKIKLHVDPKGLVEMREDQPLRVDLPIRGVRNNGVARQEYCARRACEPDQRIPTRSSEISWLADQENLLRMHRSLEDNKRELAASFLADATRRAETILGTGYPGVYEHYITLGNLYITIDDFSTAKKAFTYAMENYEKGILKDDIDRSRIVSGLATAEAMSKVEKTAEAGSSSK